MLRRLTQILFGAVLAVASGFSGTAEAKFVFNQNHTDLEWYTIETDHFHVHYPVSKKAKEEGKDCLHKEGILRLNE